MIKTIHDREVKEIQLATFYVGDMLMGMPIDRVHEINRNLVTTRIPHAPDHICGVINLRGDVVTVIDLCRVLAMKASTSAENRRNLIVRSGEESIGLCVDRVADIVSISSDEIDPAPANIPGADDRYFEGVVRLSDQSIVVMLAVDNVLANEGPNSPEDRIK